MRYTNPRLLYFTYFTLLCYHYCCHYQAVLNELIARLLASLCVCVQSYLSSRCPVGKTIRNDVPSDWRERPSVMMSSAGAQRLAGKTVCNVWSEHWFAVVCWTCLGVLMTFFVRVLSSILTWTRRMIVSLHSVMLTSSGNSDRLAQHDCFLVCLRNTVTYLLT